MVFRVQFKSNTTVALRNRYILTPKYLERKATNKSTSFLGEIQYPWRALGALLNLVNSTYHGTTLTATTGNTALLWWRGRLLALMEAALPIQVDPLTLDTRGSSRSVFMIFFHLPCPGLSTCLPACRVLLVCFCLPA
jgi:carotenoid cleavage dioxygenase-like enzyme